MLCMPGECKSWTLDSGLDHGLDYGLEYGLNSRLIFKLLASQGLYYRVLQVGCQLQNANAELSGQLKTTIE